MRQSSSYFQGNQIAVAPDGTLYNVAANLFRALAGGKATYMSVSRSNDAGLHRCRSRRSGGTPSGGPRAKISIFC